MSPRNRWFGRTPIVRATCALVLLALLGSAASHGDDRGLLRTSSADPYLFILLDTSGSMNWSPKSATCSTGDCYVPLQSDDSTSKLYQAKQALYEVLSDPNLGKVDLGFGTYNQDALSAAQKHWLYQATGNGVLLSGTTFYPAAGAREVFGNLWTCDTGNNDNEIGCYSTKPADLTDTWAATRVQRLPKGGLTFSTSQTFYIKSSANVYKVTYQPNGGSYGGTISVKVTIVRCTNSSCSTTAAVGTSTVSYTPVSDFVSWDNASTSNPDRTNPQLSYFTSVAVDTAVSNTCSGWDPNTDTTSDKNSGGYSLRWPTDSSDPRGGGGAAGPFSIGDVIPLDWKTDHKVDILKRLSPNYVDSSTVPDFRVATYLKDSASGSEAFLRLKDENKRPIFATGSTPLGASVQKFRTWYSGCSADTCGSLGGWVKVASSQDTSFECRQKFLLIVTDGDETCGGDPCKYTKLLKDQYGVITYVVAFGVTATPGNTLSCMADADHLFYPQTKDELVDDLKSVLGKINEQSSTFASAAVPSVQADVADHIYLSSFTPLNSESFWDGHLDAYLKPLPLKDGKPDRTAVCSAVGGGTRSSCWLWDAGAEMLTQAPSPADLATTIDTTTLRLGPSESQRRVFYTKAVASGTVPSTLRLFTPPTGDPKTNPTPNWTDFLNGLKIPLPVTTTDSTNTVTRVKKIIATTLEVKSATVSSPGKPDVDITYLLGDIFHADPVLVDRPDNFNYYSGNLYAKTGTTDCSANPGYQCFAKQQKHRRKMLLVGANDGQLHAIDAGVWNEGTQTFTDGTGKEIFSYIPRLALPIVRNQAENSHQIFGVDGTPRIADVFVDPVNNGTPTATEREWRTVAIGGFREGGSVDGGSRLGDFTSGYYALDLTHPDTLDGNNNPTTQGTVPTCLDTSNNTVSGCGTLPFPSILWEYTDSIGTSLLDEDKNGYPDLGQTWSVPTIGRIKVIESGKLVDKFVAIFGGGMDADNKTSPKRGNWLYMVDVETGQTLYKRALVGAAPADPAVLDKDQDGYLDTIYIGTTAGYMYKVNIASPATIQNVTITTTQAVPALSASATVKRVVDTTWDPFPVFDTGGRPIYITPTLFYVAQLSRFALAFGTGDRENLWNLDGQVGRFYLIVDENFAAGGAGLPKTEASYQALDVSSGDVSASSDFVVNPPAGKNKGWFLQLTANERVITQTFGLAGVVIFSSFQPQDTVEDGVCALGGSSHIFVVYANNGNSVMTIGGTATRYRVVPKFVTNPYVEQGATNNAPGSGGGGGAGGGGGSSSNSEQLDATQQEILQQLKKFFPKGTKFGNYWISVSGLRSDTGYERYATVPVGIIERNWKEN
ncbi:MAG: pilus assembly protein [Thermoanaerobaculia bacterium]